MPTWIICATRDMMTKLLLRALAPIVLLAPAGGQNIAIPAQPARVHPAPGTSIVRFAQIDQGVYKGSKPKTDADYRFLQSKNIKYIVDLKFFPLLYRLERNKAKHYGMVVIPGTINASPVAPSEKRVNHILCILADKRLRPIYFHCDVGRDRSSLIATLYQIQFRGLPPRDAWPAMQQFGFKDGWTLRGLKTYLQNHASSAQIPLNCASDRLRLSEGN